MTGDKVLIVGAAGWKNVGDDLIAEALVDWVENSGAIARVVGGPHTPGVGRFRPLPLSGRLADKVKVVFAVLASDYVVIGGGGLLDDRAPHYYRPFTRIAALCRRLGRKYAFVGIGVGPLQNEASAHDYLGAVEGADRVLVRDMASKLRLVDIGVSREIEVIPDPVLWSSKADTTTAVEYDLVVNLRDWHSQEVPRGGYVGPTNEQVLGAVANAINATQGPGSSVALVSMSGIHGDDDSILLEKLKVRLSASVTDHYTLEPADVERAIAGAKSVLSMRLHTCLLGALHRKKVVGLAYDPKVAAQGNVHGFEAINLDESFQCNGESIRDALQSAAKALPHTGGPAPLWHG